jgi:hypothetical protein
LSSQSLLLAWGSGPRVGTDARLRLGLWCGPKGYRCSLVTVVTTVTGHTGAHGEPSILAADGRLRRFVVTIVTVVWSKLGVAVNTRRVSLPR